MTSRFSGTHQTTLTASQFRNSSDAAILNEILTAFIRQQDQANQVIDIETDKRTLKEALFAANINFGISALMVELELAKKCLSRLEAQLGSVRQLERNVVTVDNLNEATIARYRAQLATELEAQGSVRLSSNEPRVVLSVITRSEPKTSELILSVKRRIREIERTITQKNTQEVEITLSDTSAAHLGLL